MAGLLVDLGELWELRLKGRLNAQDIITVAHYRVTVITPPVAVVALNAALQTQAKLAGGFGFQALPALPANYAGISVDCQRVFPLTERSANSGSAWDVAGASPNADTSNVAQVITRRTARAGRSEISTGHLPCPTTSDSIVGGELTPDQTTELTKWIACQSLPIVLGGIGVTLEPVIWHRGIPIEGRYSSFITSAIVQPTVRVMRRRTVGIGK